jgi:enoyl-CoA hydratase
MLEVSRAGTVLTIKLAYGKANTQDTEFCQELINRFENERENPETRAIILTGQGRIFSAGVNLVKVLEGGPDYVREFLPILSKMFETIFFYPKPVISAINGHAIAGGCVLACATDYRVMVRESGTMGIPELLVGVPFPTVALEIMRNAASPLYFQQFFYHGLLVPPEVSFSSGLVNRLVEPESLLEEATKIADNMAALPPDAFRLTKTQVLSPYAKRVTEEGPAWDKEVMAQWCSPQAHTSIRAYVSRILNKS